MLASLCGPVALAQEASQRPDESLWTAISAAASASMPAGESMFQARQRHLEQQIELAHRYLRLYPGGPRRDRVAAIELNARFELGAAAGGNFADLTKRVAEMLASPASATIEAEAAYWQLVLRRLERGASSAPATDVELDRPDAALLSDWRAYVERFPDAARSPRILALLFDDAERRGQRDEMQRIAAGLAERFAEHPIAEEIGGRQRRQEAHGREFDWRAKAADGGEIDLRALRGQRVVLLVWSPVDVRCEALLAGVEQVRSSSAALRVVGICLTTEASPTPGASQPSRVPIAWPAVTELRGIGEFSRRWGVRRTPCAFLIDESGGLAKVVEANVLAAITRFARSGR
jgi:hypothetical protein